MALTPVQAASSTSGSRASTTAPSAATTRRSSPRPPRSSTTGPTTRWRSRPLAQGEQVDAGVRAICASTFDGRRHPRPRPGLGPGVRRAGARRQGLRARLRARACSWRPPARRRGRQAAAAADHHRRRTGRGPAHPRRGRPRKVCSLSHERTDHHDRPFHRQRSPAPTATSPATTAPGRASASCSAGTGRLLAPRDHALRRHGTSSTTPTTSRPSAASRARASSPTTRPARSTRSRPARCTCSTATSGTACEPDTEMRCCASSTRPSPDGRSTTRTVSTR